MENNNILILGGTGFIGSAFAQFLKNAGKNVVALGSKDLDLLDYDRVVDFLPQLIKTIGSEVLCNFAGFNGGINFNIKNKYELFQRNCLMTMNLFAALEKVSLRKVVSLIASCAYPDYSPAALSEDKFLCGYPHETVEGHGFAKRFLFVTSKIFAQTHSIPCVCACPTTVFGPGDSLNKDRAKVIDSMIIRCIQSKKEGETAFSCWGNGTPLREVIYIDNLCQKLLDVIDFYHYSDLPINLGSKDELSIKSIAEYVMEEVGHTGKIVWDLNKPNGQHRKKLSLERMHKYLPIRKEIPFRQGLRKTIDWYDKQNFNEIRNSSK